MAKSSAAKKQVVRGNSQTSKQSLNEVGSSPSTPTPKIKKSASKFTKTKALPK